MKSYSPHQTLILSSNSYQNSKATFILETFVALSIFALIVAALIVA